MLSRISESLFWIGRYVERAEDTCRILNVHQQLLVDDPQIDETVAAQELLRVMGVAESEGVAAPAAVSQALFHDDDSPCSVTASLFGAREAARRARETVSAEMWEAVNGTWFSVSGGRLQRMRPAAAFVHVQERCAVIAGLADSTMSRDEGWSFFTLGRSLERADMTARLIAASMSVGSKSAWNIVLRGCGAHHAFIRTYGGATSDRDAAEFLLLDRLFPRSIVFTLNLAEEVLVDLEQGRRRAGFGDEALRLIGNARATLEYRPKNEILNDLQERMTHLQQVCNRVTRAVSARYFEGAIAPEWHGGEW
ncbi:alpha-E domain-containing protein [Propionicicella superfundia]|uniref:alpha-E domain-containing protein n=1 Tax=Propionicicella superfundia TaxID=348582 RepID=UPI0004135CCD|nr:alpha-E domain-containing protein [Propionicicella superfundia]